MSATCEEGGGRNKLVIDLTRPASNIHVKSTKDCHDSTKIKQP